MFESDSILPMSPDLSKILSEWPFKPGQINARIIEGLDGEPKLQVRLDLGVLQLEVDGRPDGQNPNGFDSVLELYELRYDPEQGSAQDSREIRGDFRGEGGRPRRPSEDAGEGGGDDGKELEGSGETGEGDSGESSENPDEPPPLTAEECQELRDEAIQYYHRYVALLAVQDFDRVVRDTSRNLRVLDLCAKHAETEEDRSVLEQFRPYITMVRARALASAQVRDGEPKAALIALDDGLDALKAHFDAIGQPRAFEEADEVKMLRAMRETLSPKLPVSQKVELKQRLQAAIEQENYELAAILRDELRALEEGKPETPPTAKPEGGKMDGGKGRERA